MANVVILSGAERTAALTELARQFLALATQNASIDRQAKAQLALGMDPATIATNIQALLTALKGSADAVLADAELISYTHQAIVQPGSPHLFDGTVLLQSGNGGYAIVPQGANWTGVFQKDDVVTASNAENSENNKSFTVLSTPFNDITTECVSNGDFSAGGGGAPDDWDIDMGGGWGTDWTWDSGSGTVTHVADNAIGISQDVSAAVAGLSATAENRLALFFAVTGCTAGTLVASNGGSETLSVTADGAYVMLFDPTLCDLIAFVPTSDFDGTLSSVSLVGLGGITVAEELTANTLDTRMKLTLSQREET